MKKVLLLGAGLVTKPLVRYLLEQPVVSELIIATRTVSKAEKLLSDHPKGKALSLNVENDHELEKLVAESDIAISLLPYTFHVKVAKFCLMNNTHLITTSYVSPAMKELDKEAKEKKILLMNEIGLDPGIDHMSAMKIIHNVKKAGGKIKSFESVCGGLPAPEANDNPFGYKFSWSPRGVVMAGRNNAHFLSNDEEITIEGKDLFKNNWLKEVETLGELEVYPNRDSMGYKELYGLNDAHTIFRGTFRNQGWCETLYNIARLGWLDDKERTILLGMPLSDITATLIGEQSLDWLKAKVSDKLGIRIDSGPIQNMEWLGLFSDEIPKTNPPTYLDILANRMLEKMAYKEGERDMIILQHDFEAEYPTGEKEQIVSLMIDYGIPYGDSSMSRTVSLPAAIMTKLLAEEKITLTGTHIPNMPEVYLPVLDELERMGIKMKDTITKI